MMRHKLSLLVYARKQGLLLGIISCILFAGIYPNLGSKEGPLYTEYTVKYGATSLIFVISGLTLKTDNIFRTFCKYELHFFVQIFTFIGIPLFTQIFVKILSMFGINAWVLTGLITVACMPPPVSSAVILTRAAQGNETAAIFISVLGSFIGIIITPISLALNLGFSSDVPLLGTIMQLTITVLLPLFLGQVIKNYTDFKVHKLPLNTIGQCALLFVIYTTFCDTFLTPEMDLGALDVLFTALTVLFMQLVLMAISFSTAQYFKKYFNREDVVAIVFCSTHKSLTLGIPILRIMFHGFPHLSQISLPLLVYHPTQIILGGLLVPQLKNWMYSEKNKRLPI